MRVASECLSGNCTIRTRRTLADIQPSNVVRHLADGLRCGFCLYRRTGTGSEDGRLSARPNFPYGRDVGQPMTYCELHHWTMHGHRLLLTVCVNFLIRTCFPRSDPASNKAGRSTQESGNTLYMVACPTRVKLPNSEFRAILPLAGIHRSWVVHSSLQQTIKSHQLGWQQRIEGLMSRARCV